MTTLPAGPKRMYIDKKAHLRGEPAVVVELDGVRHHCNAAEWPDNRFGPNPEPDEKPAYYVETNVEVTLT